MNKYEVVSEYLSNEKLLLEKWYIKTTAIEMGIEEEIEFKGTLPSSSEIKEKFLNWVDKHKNNLHKIICKDFNYKEKRKKYEDTTNLIIALSEVLDFDYSNALEVSSLLVSYLLDDFCQ